MQQRWPSDLTLLEVSTAVAAVAAIKTDSSHRRHSSSSSSNSSLGHLHTLQQRSLVQTEVHQQHQS
jgi:hypothetical protein